VFDEKRQIVFEEKAESSLEGDETKRACREHTEKVDNLVQAERDRGSDRVRHASHKRTAQDVQATDQEVML
jgi:hypothetical protein